MCTNNTSPLLSNSLNGDSHFPYGTNTMSVINDTWPSSLLADVQLRKKNRQIRWDWRNWRYHTGRREVLWWPVVAPGTLSLLGGWWQDTFSSWWLTSWRSSWHRDLQWLPWEPAQVITGMVIVGSHSGLTLKWSPNSCWGNSHGLCKGQSLD